MDKFPVSPLVIVLNACGTTFGRYMAFAAAVWLPYVALGVWAWDGSAMAAMPLIVLVSLCTGWGLLLYPILLAGCFAYVRFDLSPWWLPPVALLSALDLWRVNHLFKG